MIIANPTNTSDMLCWRLAQKQCRRSDAKWGEGGYDRAWVIYNKANQTESEEGKLSSINVNWCSANVFPFWIQPSDLFALYNLYSIICSLFVFFSFVFVFVFVFAIRCLFMSHTLTETQHKRGRWRNQLFGMRQIMSWIHATSMEVCEQFPFC